ncbi:hypothetical protein BHK69_01035 [Bosea vaviloviae]|uniref:Uncharacterized protein n=1 Tax=Bosea vaviloviae TaxID=1526658 RepID=A0A1D7TVW4_9HYPH|nr:hypothetical protein BHK69_01035 [Bosea vaviloviae]
MEDRFLEVEQVDTSAVMRQAAALKNIEAGAISPDLLAFFCSEINSFLRWIQPGFEFQVTTDDLMLNRLLPNRDGYGFPPISHVPAGSLIVGWYHCGASTNDDDRALELALMRPSAPTAAPNWYQQLNPEGDIRVELQPGMLILHPAHVLTYAQPQEVGLIGPIIRIGVSLEVLLRSGFT